MAKGINSNKNPGLYHIDENENENDNEITTDMI